MTDRGPDRRPDRHPDRAGGARNLPSPGSTLFPFQYAVLRAVPQIERGESINVAVLLYCQERDFLGCAGELDPDRLLALDPGADLEAVRSTLGAVASVCAGGPGSGLVAAEPLRVRFGWLTAPRSTVVQAGPVHSGLTADPAAELAALAIRLVAPLKRQ